MYDLRFVLDGVRSLFRLVDLTCVFMFKTNSLVHPKNLYQVVFFWYRQDQKGTGGTVIPGICFLTVGEIRGAP